MPRMDASELLNALGPSLRAAAKNVLHHTYGPDGMPRGTHFADAEDLAVQVGDLLIREILQAACQAQAARARPDDLTVCPSCAGPSRRDPTGSPPSHARSCPGGAKSPGTSPPATAPAVGGLFFPQSKSLGLDFSGCGPAMQRKVVYAAVTNPSFTLGSQDLADLAEAHIPAKQVERIAKGIGQERYDERDKAAAAYLALPLVERKGRRSIYMDRY